MQASLGPIGGVTKTRKAPQIYDFFDHLQSWVMM